MAASASLSCSVASRGQFLLGVCQPSTSNCHTASSSAFQFRSTSTSNRSSSSLLGGPSDRLRVSQAGARVRVSHRRSKTRHIFCSNSAEQDGSDNGNGSTDGTGSGDGTAGFNSANRTKLTSRRDMLLEYVKNVQPEFMEKFVKRAPEQVVDAMRQTVTNMLGTLPPQFFEISVTTVAENLAQLMYSVMMTGYMFRNAQFRLELQQSLTQVALPEPKENSSNSIVSSSVYEPGVNKSKVAGEVVRWHKEDGPEKMAAVEYIRMLESEIHELQLQLESSRVASRGRNELLEYLKSLQPQNLQELTSTAGEDALEAMNTFVSRLLGVSDPTQLKRAATETSAAELAKLLYWLMVVGYSIRNIEVRYDMERVLGMPAQHPKLAELSPGERVSNNGLTLVTFVALDMRIRAHTHTHMYILE
ncbi:hypothetical protein R1sor_016074 [Riccia sorocarpa]|uniref:Uncharacterized protein n=1 Tax=Riccia sorocarpa TaxID=122646 RepID=A0ABD3HI19_9MARC